MSGNIGPVEEGRRTESFDETGQSLELESAGQPICTEPETPNLNQESPKNYFFILQDFWPVFKVFQILGLFPCKKETNENGTIQLKPIRWWIPVVKFLGLLLLMYLPLGLLYGYLNSSSKEVSAYFIDFVNRLHSKNSARNYLTHFFGPLTFVSGSGLFCALMIKRKELCALQETFSSPLKDKAKNGNNKIKQVMIYFLLVTALTLIIAVSFPLYVFLPLQELLATSYLTVTIPIVFLLSMITLFSSMLIINAITLYLQLTFNIMNLAGKIDLDSMKFGVILENTANLMKILKMNSSFLSLQCFFMTFLQTFMLIAEVFTLCDYLTGTSSFHPFAYVSIVASILLPLLVLCIFNWQSDDIKQRLSEIRFYISNFAITENNFVVIEKQKHPEKYARKIVMSMLDEFKGFDACGYFTLGKDFLGCIIMLCISYVLILIDFSQ